MEKETHTLATSTKESFGQNRISFSLGDALVISNELEMRDFSSNQRIILCSHLIESTSIMMEMFDVTTFYPYGQLEYSNNSIAYSKIESRE